MKTIKKIFAMVLMVTLMVANVPVAVSAAEDGSVKKGTPVVDGTLDYIYTQSASVHIGSDTCFYSWGAIGVLDASADAYLLWDDSYLYVAVVGNDSTPMSAGEGAGWANDSAELWITDEGKTFKLHGAADGNYFSENEAPIDTTKVKTEAVMTNDGWVVEFAIPLNNMAEGKEFKMSVQQNDIFEEAGASGSAIGSQAADLAFVCSAETVQNTVFKGTPEVDGNIDAMYLESASITINGDSCFYSWGDLMDMDGQATAYLLWDDSFLYVAVKAKDATPVAATAKEWANDAAECWFTDEEKTYKVHAAADGTFFTENELPFDAANAENGGLLANGYWTSEFAIPMNSLAAEKTFKMCLQVNDIAAEDAATGYAYGSQTPEVEFVCVDTEAKNTVLQGTPIVDGTIDGLYKSSASITITGDSCFYSWGELMDMNGVATAYMLWDADYLYVAVEATDATPVAATAKEWANDAAECWFTDEEKTYKVHAAADGTFFTENELPFDAANAENAGVLGTKGWTSEFAIPMNSLAAEKAFKMCLQVNDIAAADAATGYAYGSQTPEIEFVCSDKFASNWVVEAAVEEEPVVEESSEVVEESSEVVEESSEVVEESSEVAEEEASANYTGIIIAVVVVIVVAVAVVVIFKKKKA